MTVTFDIPDEVGFMSYTLVAAEFYGIDHCYYLSEVRL